ncbi:hypothetical protein FDG2_5098 [Candidatus Protofrankia californiensis]|uniref:Acyl-CoA dehydrogenase/oxidase N-terminal domain-containing protein n=1 Tax=Candidatus Protofrankia californiensis TaxID=1839754 RepID=A0A1C3PAV5_9ACTN|nr:hypothetical protein FDG2_5098 [Candidatus Protofrankia californiensis]
MERTLYDQGHEDFRAVVREFVTREVTPHQQRWDEEHLIDRAVWTAAGTQRLLGLAAPEEYDGAGQDEFVFDDLGESRVDGRTHARVAVHRQTVDELTDTAQNIATDAPFHVPGEFPPNSRRVPGEFPPNEIVSTGARSTGMSM